MPDGCSFDHLVGRIQVEHMFVLRQLGRAGDKVISPLLVAPIEGVGNKSRATGYVLSTLTA
jgi:hypothetical protein